MGLEGLGEGEKRADLLKSVRKIWFCRDVDFEKVEQSQQSET